MKYLTIILFLLFIASCSRSGIKNLEYNKKHTTLSCGDDRFNLKDMKVDKAYYTKDLNFRYYLNGAKKVTKENCRISITYTKTYEMANIKCKDDSQSLKGPFKEGFKVDSENITVLSKAKYSDTIRSKKDCNLYWTNVTEEETQVKVPLTKWTVESKNKELARRKRRKQEADDEADDAAAFMLLMMAM